MIQSPLEGEKLEEDEGLNEKAAYVYEVFPINFNMLPDERQAEVVDRFKAFLNGLA